jgi:N-acetyl-1-D-myo-inositol-2-amino-2-deoxy-alpha-D-glucopyranoside deacetylase
VIEITGARLLLVCPHPDDETLAAGLLLQEAAARAADLRIICVTDGENNPIPQWLAERSLNRERWARRRRHEARAAIATLGLPFECVEFWGLPDQGLPRCIRDLTRLLRTEIADFRPTIIVAPSPHDLHADHVAAGLSTDAASAGKSVEHLSYVIHGQPIDTPALLAESNPFAMQRKRAALDCHASQLLASRARMEAICQRREAFRRFAHDAAHAIRPFRSLRRVAHVLFERIHLEDTHHSRPTSAAIAPDEVIA